MAGNIETLLVRISEVIENKHGDTELSEYVKRLNSIFLKEKYLKDADILANDINKDFHEKYLKEWKIG